MSRLTLLVATFLVALPAITKAERTIAAIQPCIVAIQVPASA